MFLMMMVAVSAQAQDVPLTLEEALDAALKNNQTLTISRLDAEAATAQYKQTQAVFLPQIKLSYTALNTNNPLNAFGFKLQQQAITAADFNPDLLNHPASTTNFMTKAEWLQPIFNPDMMAMRKAAHEQVVATQFATQRTRQYITWQVAQAYAQVAMARRAEAVMAEALKTVQAMADVTHNRYEKGYLQGADVLQVKVQVSTLERQLSEARSQVQDASDELSLLMGVTTRAVYQVDTTALHTTEAIPADAVPAGRADLAALQAVVAAQDARVASAKGSYLPKLNAFGEYLFNDAGALGFGSQAYLVGGQLSWTLFNGMATKHQVEAQRLARSKAETQLTQARAQAQVDLDKARRQWSDAQLNVTRQAVAVQQATEALRISQHRYAQGLLSTTDLLQAQTLVSQQKLLQAQAVFQANATAAYITFLTTTSEK